MAKTKQCRDCKAEIPKNAKKCMHCGTRQARDDGLGGLIVVLIFGYFIFQAVSPASKPTPAPIKAPLTAAQKAAKAKQEKDDKASRTAWVICSHAIKKAAKFPSTVDISTWSSPATKTIKGGGYAVFIAFESKNGLGNMIPQMARCDVIKGNLTYFTVSNR